MSVDLLAERYRRFAALEAQGVSPSYARFALDVARDADLLATLATLPQDKQQPNLLLAATRHAAGLPKGGSFAHHVQDAWARILPVIKARRTQTNEPARCACLLPALAQSRDRWR